MCNHRPAWWMGGNHWLHGCWNSPTNNGLVLSSIFLLWKTICCCWEMDYLLRMWVFCHNFLLWLTTIIFIKITTKFSFISVVLFNLAAVVFPLGFHMPEIGGVPFKLPNGTNVGPSFILFVFCIIMTVASELFLFKICPFLLRNA